MRTRRPSRPAGRRSPLYPPAGGGGEGVRSKWPWATTRGDHSGEAVCEPFGLCDHLYLVKRPGGAPSGEGPPMRTALVERARDGDEDAFTQLGALHGNRCFAIAYRILRDVARAKDAG